MRSLLRYFIKNYAFVLFLLLEAISAALVFNYNAYHKAMYLNSSNRFSGAVYESYMSVKNYFHLARINKQLAEENTVLRSLTGYSQESVIPDEITENVIVQGDAYNFTSAMVINNSVNKPLNYITINRGAKHGIKPDQGIITHSGIVGVTLKVSDSYSLAMSVLNSRWSVSAKIRKNGYFGSLVWEGGDYRRASLKEIPVHVNIAKGDTVVTSGFSTIFPEGIPIGTIQDFYRGDGDNYYTIILALGTDFKSLSYVEIIENSSRDEIWELEKITGHD
ncbi:MAG: rod shape-determining protein MreC [Prolixibacteraceae bacterium]|jgi:rod shape-determining protein MreC|nr:rod shape-determining protein MreC [Prolixibacteraceae bacterium]MDD4756255.1 rod shape-determining protein MreC [Prolixibacteraceae bacterium]NLO02710.1 rod shape-determining protein MreC [Bacteroidales bacterium]